MSRNLMEMLNEGIVLGDGGMFLEANWRGYDVPGIIGSHPDVLQQIHRDFYNSGAEVLQALTWFTSGAQLEEKYGWGGRVDEINRTGIRAAKEGSDWETPVGGCLVSTMTGSRLGEQVYNPEDPSSGARAQAEWEEQIAILIDAGADFLIPETFFRLDEMRLCVESCAKSGVPTMALMGIGSDRQTQDGATAAECARILVDEGADIVGTVCIGDPDQMLPTTLEMREAVDVPIACQPKAFRQTVDTENVGYAVSRHHDGVTPDEMAAFALKAREEGINFVGCCCGAGPSHVRAMADALGKPLRCRTGPVPIS